MNAADVWDGGGLELQRISERKGVSTPSQGAKLGAQPHDILSDNTLVTIR